MKTAIFLIACLWIGCHPHPEQQGKEQEEQQRLPPVKALEAWLALPVRGVVEEQPFALEPLSREEAEEATRLILDDERQAFARRRGHEWGEKRLAHGKYIMPFMYRVFGEKPADGRSLYISLHGGGNTSAAANDGQWRNQLYLYTPREGVYVAPRAAVNDWNMWFQPHVDTLVDRLIRLAVIETGVNPDKVYLLGYSAGGDGVYRLAPRLADRWAAASMMAGHPGDVSPLGLRNIGFMLWMGANDSAYNRNSEAVRFGRGIDSLALDDPRGYRHETRIVAGKGHWMDQVDTLAIPWMAAFRRNPLPERVAWQQDDVTRDAFYWLSVPADEARARRQIVVSREGNTFTILRDDYPGVTIHLNDAMVDLDQPVKVIKNGKTLFEGKVSRDIANIYRSVEKRGDPGLVFSARVTAR
ncbi:MAG: alpha/beta hydrolase [Odoribacteraceae bacterium]|jgi:hypothetical protein|nr:alpha/beta hydrolase [Odoribacteraceae bacterium]